MVLKRAAPFAIHCNTAGSNPKRLELPAASQAAATDLTLPSRKKRQWYSGDTQVDQPPAKFQRPSSVHQLEAFGAANHSISNTHLANGTCGKIATPQPGSILCKNTTLPLATALATASFEEAEATLKEYEDARTFWSKPDLNVELTKEMLSMSRTPGFYSLYYCFILTEESLHARVSQAFACVVLYKLCCESYSCSSIVRMLQQANLKAPRKKNAPRNKNAPRRRYGLDNYVKSCMTLGKIYCNLANEFGGYGIVCLLPVIDDAIWRDLAFKTLVAELRKVKLDKRSMPHHQFASCVWRFGIDATYDGTRLLLPNDASRASKRAMRDSITTHRPSEPVTVEITDICPFIRALKAKDYPAERMLSLLHFLTSNGRSIRKSLLLAAGGTQARWSSSGDHEHFDARCLGLDEQTFAILTDKKRLQETLVLLETKGTIQQTSDKEDSNVSIATKCLVASEGVFGIEAWKQAMIFISFFFAGCEHNNNFNLHGTWALPLFQTLLDRYHECVDFPLAEQVVPALLQASKFSDQPWKRRAIELIELMPWSSLASHVRAYFAYRKSQILLTSGDLQGAKQAITTYFAYSKQLGSLADCRLNAIHGYLQHSLAWIAFKSGRFDEALALADDWSPFCPKDSTLPICELRASLKLRKMRGIAKMHAIRHSEKASGAIDESAFRQTAYTSAYWTSVGSKVEANSQDEFSDAISPFGYYIDSSSIEELFRNITSYFEKSCRAMILDNYGALPAPDSAELCNNFDSYCFTATVFLKKGSYVEFRHALSKACALVEQILRAKHPRTLACFFEVFIHLIQTGLPRLTSYLREYVKRMSSRVIQQGHPWGQIFWHLGELDSESLEQVLARAWKCTADIFDRELGAFSSLAVSYRLDYIKRVFGITNYPEEEQLLRDLLAQFGDNPTRSTPRVMLNLAHNLNRQRRHDEAEKIAVEVLSLLPKHEMYGKRIVERIESLKIVSRSQFDQGSILLAEKTIRMAIQMIVDQWGVQHPWVPEFMNVLEGWLRSESREKDANTLKEEIKKLMGEDEISEQLTGV